MVDSSGFALLLFRLLERRGLYKNGWAYVARYSSAMITAVLRLKNHAEVR